MHAVSQDEEEGRGGCYPVGAWLMRQGSANYVASARNGSVLAMASFSSLSLRRRHAFSNELLALCLKGAQSFKGVAKVLHLMLLIERYLGQESSFL